jgi:hypothetical protein
MEQQFFIKTKQTLYELIDLLNVDYKNWFEKEDIEWQQSLSDQGKTIQMYFQEISAVNQQILNSIKKTNKEIYQGKINNRNQYLESDFIVVDVLMKIYSEFSTKKISSQAYQIQDLKQIIILQMDVLFQEIERFPDDFASNVKNIPGTITSVKLDFYQLIYLALCHAKHQIIQLKMNNTVIKSIRLKKPKLQMA